MKKRIYFIPLVFLVFQGLAQISNEVAAYYPDGKKVEFKFNTIKDLLDTLGVEETTNYSHKLGQVYFKRLTNKPILVLFFAKSYPIKVREIIDSYNYSDYLNSYDYYWDLRDMIRSGKLSKEYLQEIFKDPDVKGQEEDGSEYWIYKNYNAKIIFESNKPKSADVINYKAFQRNELAIPSFSVSGGDYTIGCNISLTNFSEKTIKYVFITVTVTNPVDDKVGTKTIKAIGPIKPSATGSYEFDNIIYSRVAKYLTIDKIKVQYMDGSIKNISKKEAQNIRIIDWEEFGNRTGD